MWPSIASEPESVNGLGSIGLVHDELTGLPVISLCPAVVFVVFLRETSVPQKTPEAHLPSRMTSARAAEQRQQLNGFSWCRELL